MGVEKTGIPSNALCGKGMARAYAAALIEAPTFSMISPIWFSLMMSGGISSIVPPDGGS
jgi:hypothetical protein